MSEQSVPSVPDPNGPPVLSYASKGVIKRAGTIGAMCIIGGGTSVLALLVLAASNSTPARGALRSHRITWEQRQMEIAQAQSDASEMPATACPEPSDEQ